ncbi:MAG: 3-deoxy-manno-octulosonate cytidylyltransferase [Bacteroidota bacterium]|nr:3-deoxy-manno-octulosonate cytidylyltransferase [Bacteroidota bacterium]
MEFLGIIPARYGSTRLEGKPLVDICGKPMIQWVYEQATQALEHVYVATDDNRIAETVKEFGGKVIMTSPDHHNGTSRCLEAYEKIVQLEGRDFDAAINIQGDEPMLEAASLKDLIKCFDEPGTEFATLVIPVSTVEELFNDSEVFVTFDLNMNALYFSRSVIPHVRGHHKIHWLKHTMIHKHLGLYAYTLEALRDFSKMPPSRLEKLESLEQNRWIENGRKIRIGVTTHESIPVDTKDDLRLVRELMEARLSR